LAVGLKGEKRVLFNVFKGKTATQYDAIPPDKIAFFIILSPVRLPFRHTGNA
jgi:hypothetical protein